MKTIELVKTKIQQIKEYNGMSLDLSNEKFKKSKGLISFEIDINTNFQSMQMYKLEALSEIDMIDKAIVSGHNRMLIYFKK